MFTGIIEEMGTILEVAKGTHSAVLTIAAGKVLEDVHIGDSIAVNGVCLTVTSFDGETFTADVMHETLNRSSLAQCKRKSPVNLERACRQTEGLAGILWQDMWMEPDRSLKKTG